MLTDFIEDYQSDKADPLDSQTCEFDFDSVCESLGEATEGFTQTDREEMGRALRLLIQWTISAAFTSTGKERAEPEKIVGRRLIALAWVLSPDYFENSPSLSKLAERLGYTKFTLSIVTSEFSAQFGITNRSQAHARGSRKPRQLTALAGQANHPGEVQPTNPKL